MFIGLGSYPAINSELEKKRNFKTHHWSAKRDQVLANQAKILANQKKILAHK